MTHLDTDTMPRRARHGCVVMASGEGTRFGGNKLLADLGGEPLVLRAIRAADGLFARRVVVTRHSEVANLCRAMGVAFILHDEPERNGTVRLGVNALGGCDTITFLQGDQPLIASSSLATLVRSAEKEPACIWRASFEGSPGAPVLFPSWAFDELRALPPGKGGGFVARAHKDRVRCVEVTSEWELFDIDTTDDLRILQEYLASEIE